MDFHVEFSSEMIVVWKITHAVIYGLLFLGGLINLLLMYLIPTRSNFRTVSNIQIFNICLADFLYSATLPVVVTTQALGRFEFGQIVCYLVVGTEAIAKEALIIFVFLAAVERYLSVCRPHFRRRFWTIRIALLFSVMGWLVSGVIMVPLLRRISYHNPGPEIINETHIIVWGDDARHHCSVIWPMEEVNNTFVAPTKRVFVGLTSGFFLLVTLSIVYCYIQIYMTVSDSSARINRHTQESAPKATRLSVQYSSTNSHSHSILDRQLKIEKGSRQRAYKKVTKMVAVLISFYLACWMPYWFQNFLVAFRLLGDGGEEKSMMRVVSNLVHMLPYLSCGINPLIYAFLTDNFRDTLCGRKARDGRTPSARFNGPCRSALASQLSYRYSNSSERDARRGTGSSLLRPDQYIELATSEAPYSPEERVPLTRNRTNTLH